MKKLILALVVLGLCFWGGTVFAYGIDDYTVLMLHFDGENGSTDFVDSSFSNHTVTPNGNVHISTAEKKFGTASALFNEATADYLTVPDSTDWYFGSGDFTVDFQFRFNDLTNTQVFCGQLADSMNQWFLFKYPNDLGNKLRLLFYGSGAKGRYNMIDPWVGVTTDTWYHIAAGRNGANGSIFINGVSQTLEENIPFDDNDVEDILSDLGIGHTEPTYYLNGYMDEFRISKGIARWTSDFTPPTSAYAPVPEPATLSLLGLGLLGLVFRRRKR